MKQNTSCGLQGKRWAGHTPVSITVPGVPAMAVSKLAAFLLLALYCVECCAQPLAKVPKPYETGNLRAFVNTDDAIVVQNPYNFGPEALFTDVSYFARGVKNINSLADVSAFITDKTPSAIVGGYHSSLYAIVSDATLEDWKRPDDLTDEELKTDPRLPGIGRVPTEHYVQAERFAPEELLLHKYDHPLGMRCVDLRQPAVRAKLVGMVVDDAMRMGCTALMTDEWSPSATWDGGQPWFEAIAAYEAALTKALHAHGILHFPNMHFRVGGKNDFDGTGAPRLTKNQLIALASNCDCMLLERGCDSLADPQGVIEDYQTIAATGTPCVLMGQSGDFLAGLSMLTGTKDGPLNYVGYAVWQQEPKWKWYPARLGSPLADVKWVDKNTASRLFSRGKLILHFDTMSVEQK